MVRARQSCKSAIAIIRYPPGWRVQHIRLQTMCVLVVRWCKAIALIFGLPVFMHSKYLHIISVFLFIVHRSPPGGGMTCRHWLYFALWLFLYTLTLVLHWTKRNSCSNAKLHWHSFRSTLPQPGLVLMQWAQQRHHEILLYIAVPFALRQTNQSIFALD